ncbi:hypothetical protein TNCV_5119641 [Trichonephila clavipes]|nr:hypothetical protein TNCV_5119641 [Trichonephila clavipes]
MRGGETTDPLVKEVFEPRIKEQTINKKTVGGPMVSTPIFHRRHSTQSLASTQNRTYQLHWKGRQSPLREALKKLAAVRESG